MQNPGFHLQEFERGGQGVGRGGMLEDAEGGKTERKEGRKKKKDRQIDRPADMAGIRICNH